MAEVSAEWAVGLAEQQKSSTLLQKEVITGIEKQSRSGYKSILITEEKKTVRDASIVKRKRLQKVYFQLPQENKKWWKFDPIEPRSKFVARWKIFMLLPLSIEVWVFPYRLALGVPSIRSEMQINLVEFVIDLICIVDMAISLCTMIPSNSITELPVRTFAGISRVYFRTKFIYEILPCYPYWIGLFLATNQVQDQCGADGDNEIELSCMLMSSTMGVELWWGLSALRVLPRFYRLIKDFKDIENNLEITVRALQVLKFSVLIFLTAHWVGCFFYFSSVTEGFGPETWVWTMEYLLPQYTRFGSSMSTSYLVSLYRGFNALSNLEYVLGFPLTIGDQIFSIIVMVVAVWLEGIILGTLLNYMVDKDPVAEAHKKEMEDVNQFIENKKLTIELGNRLRGYFEFQYQKAVENRASSSVRLPRSLMIKVSECKYKEALDKCTVRGNIFFGCDQQFLAALLMKLKVVFLMPNEELFKKDDLSKELCFVLNGACHLLEDDKVKSVVRHDVPNIAPVLGELAYFFGIIQPYTVRARPDGDVQILVLTREEGNQLFYSYPEDLKRICNNILQNFGLDESGRDIAQDQDDDNADFAALKLSIKTAIAKQKYESFSKMTSAAKSGDVDSIRELLRCGADLNGVDYDGRSAFAMACYEGSYKVVELLLDEGVDKDTKNRWNKTPLNEAMSNRQGPVVELLLQWKAGTDPDQALSELSSAASRGNLEEIRRLITSKTDPNLGDYDRRTALHMASQRRHLSVVQYLLDNQADVNIEDRWGTTPLEDAVTAGDEQIALLLRVRGAKMSKNVGVQMLNRAAAKGDVKTLNLLVKCAGLEPNLGDLDCKRPIHYASEESRLLAVSYLISVAADPDVEDRWGNKPLDLALKGDTDYHLYCARLIDGWGGTLGTLEGTELGRTRYEAMKRISMIQVRNRINLLLESGYDLKAPIHLSNNAVCAQLETVHKIVEKLHSEDKMAEEVKMVQGMRETILKTSKLLCESFSPYLSDVPLKKGGHKGIQQELKDLLRSMQDENLEHGDDFEDIYCAVDSDEEEKLFEELDYLVDLQERAEAFKGNKMRFIASSFQRAFMNLSDLEGSFRMVCEAFRDPDEMTGEPFVLDGDTLQKGMQVLNMPEATLFETEEMMEHGMNCFRSAYGRNDDQGTEFPVHCLVAGSERFRQSILKLKTDPIYCALVKSHLADYLSQSAIKHLSKSARELEYSRVGKVVYNSEEGQSSWYVLLVGKLKATSETDDAVETMEITENMIFGGYHAGDNGERLTVEVTQPSKLIELNWEVLESMSVEDFRSTARLMAILGSSCWKSLSEQANVLNESSSKRTARPTPSFRKDSTDIQLRDLYTEPELDDIKQAFTTIHGIWNDLAIGSETVSYSVFEAIHEHVGEMGSELFRQMFLTQGENRRRVEVSRNEYWLLWMRYISRDTYGEFQFESEDDVKGLEGMDANIEDAMIKRQSEASKSVSCLDGLRSRYIPSRRLNDLFFSDLAVERYETSYMLLVGDLKKPMPDTKVREFLEMVFPSFPYPISSYNVKEAMELFGRHGAKSTEINWSDIRKILREKKGLTNTSNLLLIKNALNPLSWHMQYWSILMKMLAVYYFMSIPIRISFLPWASMVVTEELGIDLAADCICMLNVIVFVNTAYKNSRAMWVTRRSKIARKMPVGYFVAALPLDWGAYLCGATNQLSCWLRLPKLVLMHSAWANSYDGSNTGSERSGSRRLFNLARVVFGIIHIGSCIWFYIGSQYQYWFPDAAISWYYIAEDIVFSAYHETTNSIDDSLHHGSNVFTQYVISFYWVSATITSNGTVGDVLPSNTVEIIFTIILMIFNLTLFRYVTGEVSSVFMKADEEVVNARAGLEALESFLKDKRLGKDLQESIRQHYKLSQAENFVDQTLLFSKIPHSLKMEVASYVAREYLDNVHLFQGCSEKLLDSLSVLLREAQFSPEEYLYRAGEMATEMFFIISGSVEEVSEVKKGTGEKIERTLARGKGTGDLAFFFGIRHFVGARGSKMTGAVCLRLPREEFLALLEHFPDDEERIAQASMVSLDIQSTRSRSKHSGSVAQRSVGSGSRSGSRGVSSSNPSKGEAKGSGDDADSMGKSDSDSEGRGSSIAHDAVTQRVEGLRARRKAERTKLMLNAAGHGDIETLKQALKSESVNVSDTLKRTPLHVASSEGQVEVVKFLLDTGAEVNCEDAFRHTSLNDAVRHKHDAVAKVLRERGGKLVLEGSEGGQLLCQAARDGNLDEVKRLIVNGVPANAQDTNGRTALHIAASEGIREVVEFLLESQADANCRDGKNLTPLDDAVRHRHVEVQKLIRDRGGVLNVNVTSSLMCYYAATGDVESIRILVENGADCSARNHELRTPAHIAASNGMISVLDFLLTQGSKFEVNAVDRMGGTPLEDAMRHDHEVAALLLKRHGGMRSDDPRLEPIMLEQHVRLKHEMRDRRVELVNKSVTESPEMKGWALLTDSYTPGLQRAAAELESASVKIESSVAFVVPVVENLFGGGNNVGVNQASARRVPTAPATLKSSHSMRRVPKTPVKLVDDLIGRLQTFSAAISATSEAANADFPRQVSLRMVLKDFRHETRFLLVKLKIGLDIIKTVKRILQELRAMSLPRSEAPAMGRRYSMEPVFRNASSGGALSRIGSNSPTPGSPMRGGPSSPKRGSACGSPIRAGRQRSSIFKLPEGMSDSWTGEFEIGGDSSPSSPANVRLMPPKVTRRRSPTIPAPVAGADGHQADSDTVSRGSSASVPSNDSPAETGADLWPQGSQVLKLPATPPTDPALLAELGGGPEGPAAAIAALRAAVGGDSHSDDSEGRDSLRYGGGPLGLASALSSPAPPPRGGEAPKVSGAMVMLVGPSGRHGSASYDSESNPIGNPASILEASEASIVP